MHVRIIAFLIYMSISLPLYILYIIQLVLLKIRTEFSSSFYTLFIFTGVVDLLFFTMNVLFYYLPFLPGISQFFGRFTAVCCSGQWQPEYSWLFSVANTVMYLLPTIQDATNILVSLNRFLALLFPMIFHRVFSRKFTLAMLPLAILFSFSSCFVTIAAPGYFKDMSLNRTLDEKIYMLHGDSYVHFPMINRNILVSSHLFACNGFCFVVYSIIAVQMFRRKVTNAIEFRLFLLGFLILLCNIPAIAYQMYWPIWGTNYAVFMALPWVILVKTLTPPLLMLLTNAGMRREIRLLLPNKIGHAINDSTTRDMTVSTAGAV